ncbi:MAG: hypothetical protein WD042_01300 [Phycisphaeraceae bacterium]
MKFDLIDRIVEQDDDHLTAVKSVSAAEEYLADHFPGFPVLPGVMMLETLVQAARRLLEARRGPAAPPLVLAQVRNVRYGNMVRPGQSLRVQVTLRGGDDQAGYDLAGVGSVDDQVAVQGRFTLKPLERKNEQ